MFQDAHGLHVTAASAAAVQAFDHALMGYLSYRADMPQRMAAVLDADAEFGLAHCLKGYLVMLSYKQAALPMAEAAAADARRFTERATPRERAHVAALQLWINGEPDRAAAAWEQILSEHPRDVLAFRLAHFVNFWLGRPDVMLASVLGVERHWSEAMPGYGAILGCRCFAHEECGHYTEAEAAGRAAIDRDPGDLWAAHGVAHVLEMQGRRSEGIAWIDGLRPNWEAANNLRHHLWWHAAMFHLERGETDRVLALYDGEFRNLASRLTEAQPDLYIDVQNAASMLFRLQRQGVDVGDRWVELADRAEARIGDCLSAFTLPHWMMALAATGRHAAAQRMLEAMRGLRPGSGHHRVTGWTLCIAGLPGGACTRMRRAFTRGLDHASGSGRHVPARRQSRPAGRARAALSRRGNAGGATWRRAADARARCRSKAGTAATPRGLRCRGSGAGVLSRPGATEREGVQP